MIKAIIFDMDGLLIDSEPVAKKTTLILMKEYGINFSGDTSKFLGLRNIDILKMIKDQYGIKDSVQTMFSRQLKIYFSLAKNIKAMPGLSSILKLVERQGWKKGLATSGTKIHVRHYLKMHKLTGYFDTIVTADMVKKGKPNPETYLNAAKKFKVKPKDCLVLEDSPNGLLSAKRAGMKCIVVRGRGGRGLKFPRADAIVNNLGNINLRLINSL